MPQRTAETLTANNLLGQLGYDHLSYIQFIFEPSGHICDGEKPLHNWHTNCHDPPLHLSSSIPNITLHMPAYPYMQAAPWWQEIVSTPKIILSLLGNISNRSYCFANLAICQEGLFVQVSNSN